MRTTFLTIEEALKNANNTTNQTIKGEFVGKHVFCNVGPMVEAILKQEESDLFSYDDVENLYSYPELTVYVGGREFYFGGGSEEDFNSFKQELEDFANEETDNLQNETFYAQQFEEAAAEINELETEPQEVFEWWAVSPYLYEQLQAMGHPVLDAGSCYIWGRCTTGQAILLDYAISRICADMGILEGQESSWAK